MGNQDYQGKYLGFTFNGRHSSEFNIVRVSTSNRYSEALTPPIKDYTVDRPNNDGQYYYGSTYDKKDIKIDFAFDSMTEKQYQDFLIWVNDKYLHKLQLDEFGEKYYMAKIVNNVSFKHVCFDENDEEIYKGEGSITFSAPLPFMIEEGREEVTASSNIHIRSKYMESSSLPVPSKIRFEYIGLQASEITFQEGSEQKMVFSIPKDNISFLKDNDIGIEFDMRLGTVRGVNENGQLTKNLYNRYITSGGFFEITPGTAFSAGVSDATVQKITATYYNLIN